MEGTVKWFNPDKGFHLLRLPRVMTFCSLLRYQKKDSKLWRRASVKFDVVRDRGLSVMLFVFSK